MQNEQMLRLAELRRWRCDGCGQTSEHLPFVTSVICCYGHKCKPVPRTGDQSND